MEAWIAGEGLERLGPSPLVRAHARLRDLLVVELLLHRQLVRRQLLHVHRLHVLQLRRFRLQNLRRREREHGFSSAAFAFLEDGWWVKQKNEGRWKAF